jgi:hypothetical protein
VAERPLPRYRFGPLEDRGFFLGLRRAQVLLPAGVALVDVGILRASHTWLALLLCVLLASAVLSACFAPVGGRSLDQWTPLAGRFGLRRTSGSDRFAVRAPLTGRTARSAPAMDLPPALSGLELLTAPVQGGELGVMKDARHGTFTAVLLCRGRSFPLLDAQEKARRIEAYGDFLSAVGRDGGGVCRLQWVDVAVADDGQAVVRDARQRRTMPADTAPVRSLFCLLEEAAPVSQVHETHLAVQISGSSAPVRRLGGGDQAACTVLARELGDLTTRLADAEIHVDGVLSPQRLARVIRLAYDPAHRLALAHEGMRRGEEPGIDPVDAWPMATHDLWSTLRTESAHHRTYWVREWPRTEVGPDWLAPLLLRCRRHLRVAVTMEPVAADSADRAIRTALTEDDTNQRLRERAGWRTSARKHRETDNVLRREQELADGWIPYRYSAYLTVTAPTADELEDACAEVEQQAVHARLVLRRMVGEQAEAFTLTLPLCRGLR